MSSEFISEKEANHKMTVKCRSGFVSILGRPNAGKSTLLNAMVGSKVAIVADKPQTTRTTIQGVLTLHGEMRFAKDKNKKDKAVHTANNEPVTSQIIFLDTPGIQQPRSTLDQQMAKKTRDALADPDLILFVADASHPMGQHGDSGLEFLSETKVPCILVLNKIDIIKKARLLPLIDQYLALKEFVEIIPISGFTGENLQLLLDKIVEHLPEGPMYFPPDHITDLPARFMAGEIIREKIIAQTRQELPYACAVRVELYVEEGNLIRIAAEIYVERDGQKGIVIGAGGKMLKTIGTQARKDIEALLEKKVFLEMHVKVRERWREDQRFLQELDWRRMVGQ